MRSNYEKCLNQTLKWEGGYSDHPSDPGGATMQGVTQARYNQYRAAVDKKKQHVKKISQSELQYIYRQYYWNLVKGDELPYGLDLAVFDFAVNSGPSRAAKYLQAILGVTQDGVIGPSTLAAVSKSDPGHLAAQLCDNRLAFVKRLKTWKVFGKGWSRRIKGIKELALEMSDWPPPVTPSPKPSLLERIIKWLASYLKS